MLMPLFNLLFLLAFLLEMFVVFTTNIIVVKGLRRRQTP